jgi:hypothetical protein
VAATFDEVSQQCLERFLGHRIGDPRIIRLVQKWLKAGVLEDGVVTVGDKGTGQGSVASPLLANVYLHYVFDLWAERWRRREATGDMIIGRRAAVAPSGARHIQTGVVENLPALIRPHLSRFPRRPLQPAAEGLRATHSCFTACPMLLTAHMAACVRFVARIFRRIALT